MAECEWIVLSDYAFAGQHGKIGVIGIFDTIGARQVPITQSRACLAFSLSGEPGESVSLQVEIIGPTGQVVLRIPDQTIVLPESGTMRGVIEIQGLTLNEFGRHAIQIDVGEGVPKVAWFTLAQRTPA